MYTLLVASADPPLSRGRAGAVDHLRARAGSTLCARDVRVRVWGGGGCTVFGNRGGGGGRGGGGVTGERVAPMVLGSPNFVGGVVLGV